MLWRYTSSPATTEKKLHFTDANKASGYALEPLCWAIEDGIINGKIQTVKGLSVEIFSCLREKILLVPDGLDSWNGKWLSNVYS